MIDFDRLLGILGLVIGLIGIGLAYYFYVKTIRTKLLAIAHTKPVSLQLPVDDVPPEYLLIEDEPSRVFMLLWNRGTAPIERSDFVEPIKILPTEHVLRIRAFEQEGAAAATVDEVEKSISVDLLRPGEAIIFLIDATHVDYNPKISAVMKSADMSVFLRSAPTDIHDVKAIAAGIATFLLLSGIVTWAFIAFADFLRSKEGVYRALIAFGVPFCGLVFARLGLLAMTRVRDYSWGLRPFIPYKFFALQKTCDDINRSWTRLRDQSKVLMAAG